MRAVKIYKGIDALKFLMAFDVVVIYLSYMVFAGVLIICGMERGPALFAISSPCALTLAYLLWPPKCGRLVNFLFR